MSLRFLPYQRAFLEDTSRFIALNWSRRVGKSMVCAFRIAYDLVQAELARNAVRWFILSRGERQAKEVMDTWVIPHLRALHAVVAKVEEREDLFGDAKYRSLKVSLENGSSVTALPANPDTARGVGGKVFLDEFAFHKDSRAIWRSVFPVVTDRPDSELLVASTPNGPGNLFYEMCTSEAMGDWSRSKVTIHDAVAQGLVRDIEQMRRMFRDPIGWRQEFECEFIDDGSAWLTYDLIDAAESDGAGDPARYGGGWCYVGWDVARRRHLSVFVVLEDVGGLLVTRELTVMRGATFAAQDAELERIMDTYRVLRVRIDQTGMGEKVVEDARRAHGSRIEGVLFGSATRLDMATALRDLMEDRRLAIPRDRDLRDDLHSIRRFGSASGAPRLVAPDGDGGHADRFWAAALAASGASRGRPVYDYEAARPQLPRHVHDVDLDADWPGAGAGWERGVF